MPVCCDGEQVAKGGWEERGELLLGKKFKERGFLVIEGALEGGHELHDYAWVRKERIEDVRVIEVGLARLHSMPRLNM